MKSYTAEDILSLPFDHFTFVDLRTEEEYQQIGRASCRERV